MQRPQPASALLDHVLGWIAPTPCRGCGLGIHPLCAACRADLEALGGTTRTVDGLPIRCLGAYQGTLRELVLAAKSEVLPWLTSQLGERLCALTPTPSPPDAAPHSSRPATRRPPPDPLDPTRLDALVAVPERPGRAARHPALLLAAALGRAHGLPVLEGLVVHAGAEGQARDQDQRGRARTVGRNLLGGGLPPPGVRRVAIVDDLVTTGATLGRVRRLLECRGLEVTGAFCLAYTPRRKERPKRFSILDG